MPSNSLDQRFLLDRRSFKITDEGIHATYRKVISDQSFVVPFENMPEETIESAERQPFWLVLALFFLSLAVVALGPLWGEAEGERAVGMGTLWLALSLACGVICYWTQKRYIAFATGDSSLVLLATRPSREAVADFIATAVAARNEYLRGHYSVSNGSESVLDVLERLASLRERGAISDEEFADLKVRLLGRHLAAEESPSGQYL